MRAVSRLHNPFPGSPLHEVANGLWSDSVLSTHRFMVGVRCSVLSTIEGLSYKAHLGIGKYGFGGRSPATIYPVLGIILWASGPKMAWIAARAVVATMQYQFGSGVNTGRQEISQSMSKEIPRPITYPDRYTTVPVIKLASEPWPAVVLTQFKYECIEFTKLTWRELRKWFIIGSSHLGLLLRSLRSGHRGATNAIRCLFSIFTQKRNLCY